MSRRKNGRKSIPSDQESQTKLDYSIESQIVNYYKGRSVLVTGASGFLGKLIVEKLLRTCAGIGKIFVLIRPRKDQSAHERLDGLLESPIFDKLKELCSREESSSSFEQLKSKLVVLQGSVEQPLLGQNDERLSELANQVSVVIHSAAVLSFVGKLKPAIDTNLGGTYNVLELACKLPKLCAFIYVSTCYSNCDRQSVGEHIYPVHMEPLDLLQFIKHFDEDELELKRNDLIGQHPNNYTYTKQLAEYLCGQYAVGPKQLPVAICRPSIIMPTCGEPIRGFVDNRNGGNGFIDGISRGIVRVFEGNHNSIMDFIPADYVSNSVISLAWFASLYHRVRLGLDWPLLACEQSSPIDNTCSEQRMIKYHLYRDAAIRPLAIETGISGQLAQVPVFHVASGHSNPITLDQLASSINGYVLEHPSTDLFREPRISRVANHYLYILIALLEVVLVGKTMDCLCSPPKLLITSRGIKRRITSTWSDQFLRCYGLTSVVNYFVQRSFEFNTRSMEILTDGVMNDEDRQLFNCDIRRLNWNLYLRDIVLGVRRHLIGEPDETIPKARRVLEKTLFINTAIKTVVIVLVSCLLYLLLW